MKKTQHLFTLLLLVLFQAANAEPIDSTLATQLATQFYYQKLAPSPQPSTAQIVSCAKAQVNISGYRQMITRDCYYVVNFEHGFVIIAADDRVEPILAYSTESSYDAEHIPENTAAWLDNYLQEISYAISNDINASDNINEHWLQLKHNSLQPLKTGIEPLLQTTYGQGAYYNRYCPVALAGPNGHVPTGCVATAMAQIMRYWEYPERGVGSYTYVANYLSSGYGNHGTQSANFGATTYDYNLMPNFLNSNSTTAEIDEVAKLMYHCGVSVNMMYGATGSGASSASVPAALQNYFAYPSGITFVSRSSYTANNWMSLIREELNNMRPVLYDGRSSSSGGHAFVCDGYEGNYFHINWGWDGSYNGNFLLSALNPGSYNFSGNQGAVIGISAANPTIRHLPNALNITAPVGGFSVTKSIEIRGIALTDSISASASPHFKVGKTTDSLQSHVTFPVQGGTMYIQYAPESDTAITEQGCIILSSGSVSDTIFIYATAFTPVCIAPTQLTAYPVYHGINLSWAAPEVNSEAHVSTLSWDSSFYSIYSYGSNLTFCMLQRYDISDLQPYRQTFLKEVSFIPCADALSYRIVVYQGGGYSNNQYFPGEQVVNQEVSLAQLNYNSWYTVPLLHPVLVDDTKELWYGIIAYTNGNTGYILRVGASAYRASKGGIIGYSSGPYSDSTSFTWTDMAGMGLQRNIQLKGMFESLSGHVLEYDIYRDDNYVASTTETSFFDTNMQTDSTEYTVFAHWDNFCSAGAIIKTLADTNLTPCTITINMHSEQGNGWNGNCIRIHHRGSTQNVSFQYGQDSIAFINVYDGPLELEWINTTSSTECSFNITGPCLYYESPDNLTSGIFFSQNINCEAAQISTPDFTYNLSPVCDSTNVSFHYFPMTNDANITLQYGDGESSTNTQFNPSIESMSFHHSYPISGDYQVSLSVEKENCDIVRSVSKTININNIYSTSETDTVYISTCDSCIWNNTTYYESGDYLFRFDNSQGCDSLVVLHLVLFPSVQTDDYLSLCENELPYSYGDTVFEAGTVSSSITFNLTTIHGCDSIVTLHLTIYPAVHREESITLCKNELPYSFADTTFETGTVSSVFTFHRLTVHGCDSIVSLYLTINPAVHTEEELALCENELPYIYEDTIFEAGTVSSFFTFYQSTVHGCDSIISLQLTIYPSANTEDSVTICENELPYIYGDTVFEAGTTTSSHIFHMYTDKGCDSIVTLHLTITEFSSINNGSATEFHISVYPNPSRQTVNVKIDDHLIGLSKAEIYDIAGRKIKSINWISTSYIQQIDLIDLVSGIYFIKLYNDQQFLGTTKIIKQ